MNEKKKVAIQGFAGCFHEQAARLFYGKEKELGIVECGTFDGLYESLEQKKADAAIMAIENTVSGGLLPNFELLRKHDRKIKGEIFLRICQNLMVMPGQTIRDIHEVRTHYMAINQTRQFFSNYPHIRLVESEDTAKSAADIAAGKIYGVGAVASALAADLYAALDLALADYDRMRSAEGEKLKEDLLSKLAHLENFVSQVEERSPETVKEYREKLLAKLQEVLNNTQIDESRILTEAAIFADKVAVDEETVRLRSHIAQFRDLLEQGGIVGRKIDFLIQEMNRETNTIGSKCTDLTISHIVVDMKSEIEKLREQVQNIE